MCPKGDDPETISQLNRKITVTTAATAGTLSGTVRVTFLGRTTSFNANPTSTTGTECATAFTALDNVQTATCTQDATANGGATYTVTFTAWPEYPEEDNWHYHTGNPPLTSFTCDSTYMASNDNSATITCAITDANSATDSITGANCMR